MKKSRTFVLAATPILLSTQFYLSQSKWSKDDRNILYSECMSNIAKYTTINADQKESVCLCYIEEISKKYQKEEYQAKIDAELKRIRESTLTQCSKNTGVDLVEKKEEPKVETSKPINESNITKEAILGHWKDDNSEFWLFETGDYKMQFNDGGVLKGTWKIENNLLSFYKEKLFGTSEQAYKILMFTPEKFVYQSIRHKSDTFTAVKVK